MSTNTQKNKPTGTQGTNQAQAPARAGLRVVRVLLMLLPLVVAAALVFFAYSPKSIRWVFNPATQNLAKLGLVVRTGGSCERLTAVDTLWLPLIATDDLYVNDLLKTGNRAELNFELINGSKIKLEADSLIRLQVEHDKIAISFFQGDIQVEDAKDLIIKHGLQEEKLDAKPEEKAPPPAPKPAEAPSPPAAATPDEPEKVVYPKENSLLVIGKDISLQMSISPPCTAVCQLTILQSGSPFLKKDIAGKTSIQETLKLVPGKKYHWLLVDGASRREGNFETILPKDLRIKENMKKDRSIEFLSM